jgi:hypothetical protein
MSKATTKTPANQKKRPGRPATGKDPLVAARMPPALIEQIKMWAESHTDGDRSKAIRQLIEFGLRSKDAKR